MRLRQSVQERLGKWSARSRAVGVFFATSVAARVLGIACQLLQVPIALKVLGPEAFGLWMTLTVIGAMIMFADFGVQGESCVPDVRRTEIDVGRRVSDDVVEIANRPRAFDLTTQRHFLKFRQYRLGPAIA